MLLGGEMLVGGGMLLASQTAMVSALSPDPTSLSTRLEDRSCRGEATEQDPHHVCGLSGDAGLQTGVSSAWFGTTELPGNSDASLELPGRTGS